MTRVCRNWGIVVAMAAVCSACGGDSTSPSSGGSTPSTPPVAATTIVITSAGVAPKDIVVAPGSQVTFTNNDSRDHDVASDPHPEHTDCPAINSVGLLVRGQSRQTGNLNVVRVCGFHDHQNPDNRLLQGTITIR